MNLRNPQSHYGLEHHGIKNVGTIYWNPPTPVLYEEIVRRREGVMAHLGPIVVRTGHHTGRSPNDKRIVREKTSEKKIWWSPVNVPMEPEKFEVLYFRMLAYLQGKDVFVQDCYAGADLKYQVPIRIITETAWHNLFSRNLWDPHPDPLMGKEEGDDETHDQQGASNPDDPDSRIFCDLQSCIFLDADSLEAEDELFVSLIEF